MSNFSFSNTLDGLNNINANDINTDNIVTDYLTVNINSSVPLVTPYTTNSNQIASCAFVQDAFANNLIGYALLNPTSAQTFTGSHNFPTQATANNSTLVATTAFVKNQGYAILNANNTFTATNTFNGTINKNNTTFDYSDYRFVSVQGGGESSQIFQTSGGLTLQSITNNKVISINTKDISGNAINGLVCRQGNQAYLQGAVNNRIDITGTQATIGGTSVPIITTQPLTNSNNNEIASTAFVKQNLLSYALLSPFGTQTFSGNNQFPTAATGDNSSTVATTAFVKNQGYALLGSNNTFTGINTFNGNVNLNNLFVSNNVQAGTGIYENQFFGDVYCYKSFTSQNGLFIQNQITPGAITYLSIDPSGNIQTSTTISAGGNISSSANISGATISTVGSVTSNQLLIRDPANVSNSQIQQIGDTLFFNAISNNGSPQTTLKLSTRSVTNTYSEILSGNTNDLFLGSSCNNIRIQSPNLIIQSTSISTNATSATITGGQLIINNTLTTFNDNVVLNESTTMNNTFTFNDGANATQFDQNGVNLTVYSTGGIKLGSGFSDNIVCTSNRAYLQGTIGNTIDINGTQATIGGTSVPKITTQPLAASNTNEIASTQWTKSQLASYAPLTNLNNYALLSGTQNFTGANTFISPLSITIKNSTSANSGGLLISDAGSYNNINNAGDFAVVGFGPTINNGILNLTTWANSSCGIKIDNNTIKYNAPFNCNYNTLGTVPTKTNNDIGYIWQIPGSALPNWTTFTTPQNIATMVFDGTGNYTKGVWQVNIVLSTECINAPNSRLIWTTVSSTSNDLTKYCTYENGATLFGILGVQIMKLSFILNVTTTPSTYYLNYVRTAGVGSGLAENKTNSHIEFTRIA